MLSRISEQQIHRLRWILTSGWLLLILTFPVKSKIQQCKPLEPLSGNALRENSL